MLTSPLLAWMLVVTSVLVVVAYELRAYRVGVNNPQRTARTAHARLRQAWVQAMSAQAGFEIVAVQALRNSLMSATISASTAALAVMGAISLAGSSLAATLGHWSLVDALPTLLRALLVVVLFASYVCSAMAMRYLGHASYVMSMPVASPQRQALNAAASEQVRRAGLLYSWGLRLFLIVAPIVAGIVHPLAMLPATLLLLVALHYFDQPSDPEIG